MQIFLKSFLVFLSCFLVNAHALSDAEVRQILEKGKYFEVTVPVRHFDRSGVRPRKPGLVDYQGVCNITYRHFSDRGELDGAIVWGQIQDCLDQYKEQAFPQVKEIKGVKWISFFLMESQTDLNNAFIKIYGQRVFDKAIGQYGVTDPQWENREYTWSSPNNECDSIKGDHCKPLKGFHVMGTNIVVVTRTKTVFVGHQVTHVFYGCYHQTDGELNSPVFLYNVGDCSGYN